MSIISNDNKIVHGLWIGECLSPIEQLCIKSYIDSGHQFYLWIYYPIVNLPEKVTIMNANDVIPHKKVFSYNNQNKFGHGKGSYAGFSDIFRYKLLYEHGGWWTDMDVTCLKPLNFESPYIFRTNGTKGIVGNIIKCPPRNELMNYCYLESIAHINESSTDWMLPIRILNEGISIYKLEMYIKNISNEDSWLTIVKLLTSEDKIPSKWFAIHWMNEEWRRHGLSKIQFLSGTTIQKQLESKNINHQIIPKENIPQYMLKLSKWNYRYINLKSRIRWLTMTILNKF